MPARGANRTGRRPSRRGRVWRLTIAGAACALVLALVWGAGRLWFEYRLSRLIARGLELTPSRVLAEGGARLRAWEAALSAAQRDEVVRRLVARYPLGDARVRALLAHLSGCDFGDRGDDWNAWLREKASASADAWATRNRVQLEPLWSAPVGLTSWFSTVIPIDGSVFVASLGGTLGERGDEADGVVRVDGATGQAVLIFRPADPGLRELVGLSAADDCLFVSCQNGYCYCVTPDGELIWKARVGPAATSPPLATDVNRDGLLDAVVMARGNRVVALSGVNGRTLWVTPLGEDGGGETVHRAGLALAPEGGDAMEIIASTAGGAVARLDRRTGRRRGPLRSLNGDQRGAIVTCDPRHFAGLTLAAATRAGAVWLFRTDGEDMEPVLGPTLALRPTVNVFATPRTLTARKPRLLLACVGSSGTASANSLCAFNEGGLVWRVPAPGNTWGSPAIADLDGDRRSDIVLAASERLGDGSRGGLVTVVSDQGRTLARYRHGAAVECSPVVADVDGDQRLELLICDDDGMMHCYATGAVGPVEWGTFGGDPHNTFNAENAYSYGQAPVRFQWHWRCP